MPGTFTARSGRRDAATTRRQILDAAIAEFARYGIAGARVDRIAAAAEINKAMIYAYYSNKDGLFDAVFDAIVVQNVNGTPLDADDLPGYAARLFDQHRVHPEYLRIAAWDQLERGGAGQAAPAVMAAAKEKAAAIRAAQRSGTVSDHFAANQLLELVLTLSRSQAGSSSGQTSRAEHARRRAAIKAAVSRLTQP